MNVYREGLEVNSFFRVCWRLETEAGEGAAILKVTIMESIR
jgi:hypothetical protein